MDSVRKANTIKAILSSLAQGATFDAACEGAEIDRATFWRWRKDDEKLEAEVQSILESRISIVEDALYQKAKGGHPTSMIFFLKNRAPKRWRDVWGLEHSGGIQTSYESPLSELPAEAQMEMLKIYAKYRLTGPAADAPPGQGSLPKVAKGDAGA